MTDPIPETDPPLPASARRVADAAAALGLDVVVRVTPDTARTAEDAAKACGCAVGQIVKSLVFKGKRSGEPVLLLVAGDNRVDTERAAEAVGEPLGRADAAFVRDATGFAIGGIPPFGHRRAVPTFIDRDLLRHGEVWAAAGTPHAVFRTDPEALRRATGATVIDCAERRASDAA